MVMLAEPLFRCVDAICRVDETRRPTVVMTSPQGELFRHETAQKLRADGWVVFLCGRYEGFDERIVSVVDLELSLGDFVVSGGELPAMLMIDAISRLVEGVVGNSESVTGDSFFNGLLDYPHYTRPAEIRGLHVPDVLISGHAEKIRLWRKEHSLRRTLARRSDLLASAELDAESKKILERIKKEE